MSPDPLQSFPLGLVMVEAQFDFDCPFIRIEAYPKGLINMDFGDILLGKGLSPFDQPDQPQCFGNQPPCFFGLCLEIIPIEARQNGVINLMTFGHPSKYDPLSIHVIQPVQKDDCHWLSLDDFY